MILWEFVRAASEVHGRGLGHGCMVIVWAENLAHHAVHCSLVVWGQDFVGDIASKVPCPAGKSADISKGFVSF